MDILILIERVYWGWATVFDNADIELVNTGSVSPIRIFSTQIF
jgi:hypothetical protein